MQGLVVFVIVTLIELTRAADRPNIILIVADDLGWNDIGFRNPDMLTPNIDKLARDGVILDRNYVQPVCSPSRAAFMSGMYPFKIGLQHQVIWNSQAVCLPLNITTLPQHLKKLGYATHAVGKWHLGFCKWECTPTYRGFDSFLGYYNSREGYFTHKSNGAFIRQNYLDFRDGMKVANESSGEYSAWVYSRRITDLIEKHNKTQPMFMYLPYQNVHSPTEVPKQYSDKFPHVVNKGRRVFSGMVNALDEAIGNLTDALKKKGIYDNTLFFFTSDNGAELFSHGNSWPLRGGKHSIWEGGTRVTAFMSGAGLKKTGYTYSGMIHAVDYLPTLVAAAGGPSVTGLDGIDLWESIRSGLPSKRSEFIYNLDDYVIPLAGQAAIRMGDYKLLLGYPGTQDGWHRPMNRTQNDIYETSIFDPKAKEERLFNVMTDPEERNDLASTQPDIVAKLKARLLDYKKEMVPPNYPPGDPASNPKHYDNVWSPGWC